MTFITFTDDGNQVVVNADNIVWFYCYNKADSGWLLRVTGGTTIYIDDIDKMVIHGEGHSCVNLANALKTMTAGAK